MTHGLSVQHEWRGQTASFTFTWAVFETLVAEWGAEAWQDRLLAVLSGNPADLRYVASLADPATDTTDWPVGPTINALYRAYALGWQGIDIGEPKPEPEAKADGKKPRLSLMSFVTRGKAGSDSASRGVTSTA